MCYVIESLQHFDFNSMTGSIEKIHKDIDSTKIWITSNYDFLFLTHTPVSDFRAPFKFRVPFEGIYTKRITLTETIIKPLNCKTSDTEYQSKAQCLDNMFRAEKFSPCPIKCIPIQMKGHQYINKSTSLIKCTKLEDEICNGGPKVWNKLWPELPNCLDPCKIITYKDSRLDLYEPQYLNGGHTFSNFELAVNNIRKIEREVLVYDTNDAIGAIGGSLGLFLGFSFFDVISKCLDNLIMPLINYLVSSN